MWNEFLSKVVEGVLLAFAPVLASLITSWLVAKVRTIWAEFKVSQTVPSFMLEEIARIVVLAAEQMKLAELIENKKDYAVQTAAEWLEAQGYKINLAAIEAAIEAAVMTEFNKPVEAE